MDVAIIGGGAAGFFLAVNLKTLAPDIQITIFERQTDVLKKVLISGGGRCNLTNSFEYVTDLKQVYPRGHKLLKGLFKEFGHVETFEWFESHGVKLVTQDDHCVFPAAQDAHAIADCLKSMAIKLGIIIKTSHKLKSLTPTDGRYKLTFQDPHQNTRYFDCVAVTTGGAPLRESLVYLEQLGHHIENPAPSLFTFNIDSPALRQLMGTVATTATVSIPGTKFRHSDALLITHWGMSGPSILKLSSHAARLAQERAYKFPILVNWLNETNNETVTAALQNIIQNHPQKKISGTRPYNLPTRLWHYLIDKSGIAPERKWNELGHKGLCKLTDTLCNDRYEVNGRSAFREEFVTCGGISLESVQRQTLESKTCPGLYFAGEVLDIDGVTGGFNFQAAWSTAYIVAQAIARRKSSRLHDSILHSMP